MTEEIIRFIIITVPPPKVATELARIREELNSIAGSRAALNYPPHVTLRTGFLVPKREIERFIAAIGNLFVGEKAFRLMTEGIYCSKYEQGNGPQPIIGYRIKKEKPLLALNKKLLSYRKYRKSNRTRFEPHLTIAYKDLTFEGCDKILHHIANRRELQESAFSWICDHAGLYVEKIGRWEPYHIFSLSNE